MLKYRYDYLNKMLDDEIACMEDILKHNSDYYQNRGKTDYALSIEANYLQGRIDSLRAIKRRLAS